MNNNRQVWRRAAGNLTPALLLKVAALALLISPVLAAAETPGDPQIAQSLQQMFQFDYRLKHSEIQVSSSAGVVTLSGVVTSYLEKQEAGRIANRTAGVMRVINAIQVNAEVRADRDIADSVRRRLSQSSFIRSDDVAVQVANGVVTLTGEVPTWAQSLQAQMVAREVGGVRLVRNRLILGDPAGGGASARTDEQIQVDVEAELRRDAYLGKMPIKVTVESGVVRLEGEVPNLFHKEIAGVEARLIANVRMVDNRLVVVSQLSSNAISDPPNDAELKRLVEDELQADPRIATGDVEARVSQDRVVLSGWVASMFEKQTAERIARRVVGVTQVENQLEVRAMTRGDSETCDDIQFNLNSDSLLFDQKIVVAVKEGEVELSGEVKDYSSKNHAARLASRVRGVRSIANNVRVRWNEATNDESVQQRIVARLESNAITRPIMGLIHVSVEKGVATLSGRVGDSPQLIEAGRIAAATDGVRQVVNRLTTVGDP